MSKNNIPILMYHALVKDSSDTLNKVHIPVDLFRQEMKWLAENNYTTVSLDQLQQLLSDKNRQKYCAITFDDGYYSLYQYAMPILQQYNFTATLFLTTIITGEKDFSLLKDVSIESLPKNDRPLTWNEIKEMNVNGWSIQAHSVDHADHSRLTAEEQEQQILQSKFIIEQQIHQPVNHYAFPFGRYNTQTLRLIKKSGYASACSVHSGLACISDDNYRLPRLEMNYNDTLSSFIQKTTTGFISSKEKFKASFRNILFSNPVIKDLSKKITGKVN